MYASEHGSGLPLMLLHGFFADHRLLSVIDGDVFDGRPGWRRIYADLPGMGQSPAGPHIDSTDAVAREVAEFVDDTLGDRPYAVLGQSYGGGIARYLAAHHRDRVRGLALLCPMIGPHPDVRQVPPRTVLRRDPALIAGLSPEDAADYTEVAVLESAETWELFRDSILPGARAADEVALGRIRQRYGLSTYPESTVPPYAGPTEIICGRQDHVAGYRDAVDALEHYPRANVSIIDGAGHNAHIEQRQTVAALIGGWLDRVRETWDVHAP
ncbi:alpha/beta fold hydrolase [Solicola gregarius]|uniref:Alpha/beta hydrolase n=1 Tax=Solicola gregarius TaxID=2908642 RepID=A0AA46YMB5_9ACTN|nr:alpha/beta fold hydrolase [Solicola gregarius]UYM07557.1 alpha/beta hydrolase [Solicola gregarius]